MSRSRQSEPCISSPRPTKLSVFCASTIVPHHPHTQSADNETSSPSRTRVASVSRSLDLSITQSLQKHAAAGDVRTLPSAAPPGAAARLNRPPAQIPASADITTPRRLRWQPVPATTAAAAGRCARRPQRVRAIRQLHERPGGATRIAVWSNRIPAGTGIH